MVSYFSVHSGTGSMVGLGWTWGLRPYGKGFGSTTHWIHNNSSIATQRQLSQ